VSDVLLMACSSFMNHYVFTVVSFGVAQQCSLTVHEWLSFCLAACSWNVF